MKPFACFSFFLLVLVLMSSHYLYSNKVFTLSLATPILCGVLSLLQILYICCRNDCCVHIIFLLYLALLFSSIYFILFGIYTPTLGLCTELDSLCMNKHISCPSVEIAGNYSTFTYCSTLFCCLVISVSFI